MVKKKLCYYRKVYIQSVFTKSMDERALPDEEIIFLYVLHSKVPELAHIPDSEQQSVNVGYSFVDRDNRSVGYERDNKTGKEWIVSRDWFKLVRGNFTDGRFEGDVDQKLSLEGQVFVELLKGDTQGVQQNPHTIKQVVEFPALLYKAVIHDSKIQRHYF